MNNIVEDFKKDLDNNKSYIMFLIPLVIVAVIFCIIIVLGFNKVDNYILSEISNIVNYNLTVVMGIITSMCKPINLLLVVLFCLVIFENKRIGIGVAFALFGSGAMNLCLKFCFSRQRPLKYMLIDESGYSFPSGHAMVSMAFYGFLIYICYKMIKRKWLKNLMISLLSILIALIAFSRLYFGVHYPTDVLAGLTFGYIFLYVYIRIFNKYIFNKKEKVNSK